MAYTNEKRFKKIFISDGDTILPNLDVFYGPHASLEDTVDYINEFCDELGVDVPLGIKVAVYNDESKSSITEYCLTSIEGSFCKVSDFEKYKNDEEVDISSTCGITYEDFDNGNTDGYINIG